MPDRAAASVGGLAAAVAGRPLHELWADPRPLAQSVVDAARSLELGTVLFPLDDIVLAEACGAPVAWNDHAPRLDGAFDGDIEDVDPLTVLDSGRVSVALEAAELLGRDPGVRVAGLVPDATRLWKQLGSSDHPDAVDIVGDVVLTFARLLLECDVDMLVVAGDSEDSGRLEALAGHFRTPVGAVLWEGDAQAWPARTAEGPSGVTVVTAPLRGDCDLAEARRFVATISER